MNTDHSAAAAAFDASEQPQTIGEYMQAEQNMGAAHGNKPKRKRSGAGGGQAEQRCLRCGVTHRVGSPHECQPAQ